MELFKTHQSSLGDNTSKADKNMKYLVLGLLGLDKNPAFESEVSSWIDANGFLQIYAFIHPEEESWMSQFFDLINVPEFAPLISAIEIKGPDKGTNGTRLYDLEDLLKNTQVQFSNLIEFEIEQTSILHQNITMVTFRDYYDDNGAGGRILDKMPNLKALTLPSAPNQAFFARENHPLEYLSLQAGFEHQSFVKNLAEAKCFPSLAYFEWTDGPGVPRFTSCIPKKHAESLKESDQYEFENLSINGFYNSWKNSPRFYKY